MAKKKTEAAGGLFDEGEPLPVATPKAKAAKTAEPETQGEPRLTVTLLQGRDILGAKEFEMKCGRITVLKGENGTGKTTALEMVKASLGGGSLAKIVHVDKEAEEEAQPELVLCMRDENGRDYRVERTAKKTTVKGRVGDSAAFEELPVPPQTFLSSIYDQAGCNPVVFERASHKDRVTLFLEALDLQYSRADLLKQMGITEKDVSMAPAGLHPLVEVKLIRDQVYQRRQNVGHDKKAKEGLIESLKRSAPAADPKDLAAEIKEARKAEQDAAGAVSSAEADVESRISKLNADAAKRIDEIRAKLAKDIEALRSGYAAELADKRKALTTAKAKMSSLLTQQEQTAKARALYEQVEIAEKDAAALDRDYKKLTAALDSLDAYRAGMAKNLPIPGLEINDEAITVEGVPFDQLNFEQRFTIETKIAAYRAKKRRLPVIFVDGAEAFDSKHFATIVKVIKKEGVQAFIARVSDEPFKSEIA